MLEQSIFGVKKYRFGQNLGSNDSKKRNTRSGGGKICKKKLKIFKKTLKKSVDFPKPKCYTIVAIIWDGLKQTNQRLREYIDNYIFMITNIQKTSKVKFWNFSKDD